jgi:hypothetical protein
MRRWYRVGAGQRTRIDHQEGLADARLVAFVDEEGRGLEAELRADQRGDQQLHHQRQHRALGAAHRTDRQHRAVHAGLRVGGGLPSASSAQPRGMGGPPWPPPSACRGRLR